MIAHSRPADPVTRARVLVVDDVEVNRDLLIDLLVREGHDARPASGGEEALAAIAMDAPDLVLLDVNMPGLSGLEVCRRLRDDPRTASIPVILVTALADRAQRLDGIAAGANDYLTKPIDRVDLILRVRNALHLHRLHREVVSQFERLKALERMRDEMVQMLIHDFRTPLTGLSMGLQLVAPRLRELEDPGVLEDVVVMQQSLEELTNMVSDVLDVSRFEANAMPLKLVAIDLGTLTRELLGLLGRDHREMVDADLPTSKVPIIADRDLIRRVVTNILANALRFSPAGARVRIRVHLDDSGAVVSVIDHGPGIPPEFQARIFDKFEQAGGRRPPGQRSSGLGLAFCRLAVEAHGGWISVESRVGEGSTFRFGLPMARATERPALRGRSARGNRV